MKMNKNIDRLFQEKLKDFESSPPQNAWENIEKNLKTDKVKPLFPLWFRITSAASILILITLGGVNYFKNTPSKMIDNNIITNSDEIDNSKINEELLKKDLLNSTQQEGNIIVKTDTESKDDLIIEIKEGSNSEELKQPFIKNSIENNIKKRKVSDKNAKENTVIESNIVVASSNNNLKKETRSKLTPKEVDQEEQTSKSLNKNIAESRVSENSKKDNGFVVENTKENKELSREKTTFKTGKVALESRSTEQDKLNGSKLQNLKTDINKTENYIAISQEENVVKEVEDVLIKNLDEEEKEEKNIKRWSVTSITAPVFYNSFTANTSPLDSQFEISPKQGSKTVSYGIKIGYALNKKLSLQTGVNLVNVGYEIRDVFISPSQEAIQRLTNIDYNNNTVILSINATNFLSGVQLETISSVPVKGVLNQNFGYLEIPLELKYKLNNNEKIGINLVGGFSTLFLNKNEVSVETSEFSSNIGKANNLNNINFSGNLGIDVDYKINKNLYLNVAPMLKIHTSTFSKNADNFKPYIIGVYTGLNYKF